MRDVFGVSLEEALREERAPGSANLPVAHRAMRWVMHNRPAARDQITTAMRGHLRVLRAS